MTMRLNGQSVEDTLDALRRAQELAEELYTTLQSVRYVGRVENYILPAVADLIQGEGYNRFNSSIQDAMNDVEDDAQYEDEGEGDEGEETDGDDLV